MASSDEQIGPGRACLPIGPIGPKRRTEIYAATLALVAEDGFDRLRLDAVAQRARASKATIYRYWPSKEALVIDALGVRREVAERQESPSSGSLRADLISWLRHLAHCAFGVEGDLVVGLAPLLRDSRFAPEIRELLRPVGPGHSSVDQFPLVAEVAWALLLSKRLLSGERVVDSDLAVMVDDVLLPMLTAR